MPKIRPLPTLALVLLLAPPALRAQTPKPPAPAPAPAPPTEAERALDEAIRKVHDLRSVSAEVAQTADILGQHFVIKGRYLRAPGHRVRLELVVSGLGDATGMMVQACDGQTLWDYQRVLDASRCQRLMIGEILKKLEAPEFTPAFREQTLARMGFAGPEALLVGLRKAIKFDRKEAGTLEVQVEKGRTEAKDVWILRGEWQDREALTDPTKPPLPTAVPLPPYVPSTAVAWIGRDDGWPYMLKLEGKARSLLMQPRSPDGRPPVARTGPSPQDRPSKLVLLYGNVKLNPPLGPGDFAFQPPDPNIVSDQTKDALDGLERERAMIEGEIRKKAEADKAETTPEAPVPKLPPPDQP